MNTLLHDPDNFEATSFDQAVQKLHQLNQLSHHRDDWGKNIYLATKDLKEEFQEKFIRYLANPAGFKPNAEFCKEVEALEIKNLTLEHPQIDMDVPQKYVLKKTKANEFTVVVTNADSSDDEKLEV